MTEDEIVQLQDIFYSEAPYDYTLTVSIKKRRVRGYDILGSCSYGDKSCVIHGPENYQSSLLTMLHELAHARIQHRTHSHMWEQEFVRLLEKYNFSKTYALEQVPASGEAFKEWAKSNG